MERFTTRELEKTFFVVFFKSGTFFFPTEKPWNGFRDEVKVRVRMTSQLQTWQRPADTGALDRQGENNNNKK